MEGTLRKFVEEVKIFQRSVYPKRFFSIDFSIASIVVSKILFNDKCVMTNPNNVDKTSQKVIPFRDFQDCYLPKCDIKGSSLPKTWQWPFYVQTLDRLYVLCAKTEQERSIWMSGFRYVIASTLTVQTIMKHNRAGLDKSLLDRTKKFQEIQIQDNKFREKVI